MTYSNKKSLKRTAEYDSANRQKECNYEKP